MDGGRFGSGISKGGILTEVADTNAGNGSRDDYAGRFFECGFLLEEGGKSLKLGKSGCVNLIC